VNASTVILISLFTSVVVSAGTVFAIERLDLIPRKDAAEAPGAMVPDLKGLSEDDARANLTATGLLLVIQGREPSGEAEPGHVIKQASPPGSKVPRGGTVAVTVAKALPKVPSVTGVSSDAAATLLAQAGFTMKLGEPIVSAELAEGKVVSQSPGADTALEKGGTVTVQVAAPPKVVDVPSLLGMGYAAAKTKLEGMGLKAQIVWLSLAEQQAFIVINQKPAAGEKLKPGEEVKIYVNR
jgi:beta-lactam-binding protein with PASTA domain